jgi:hypothetical protein
MPTSSLFHTGSGSIHFEDHGSHQHYLRLVRCSALPHDAYVLSNAVRDLTDTTYRTLKRETVANVDLPVLNYHVNFIQDWSFVRSLMGVAKWPSPRDTAPRHHCRALPSYAHRLS